VLLYV